MVARSLKGDEAYAIHLVDSEHIPHDRRRCLVTVSHSIFRAGENGHDDLKLVEDYTNHQGIKPFHFNLSGLSKRINCPTCQKYLFSLDHLDVVFREGMGGGNPYKLVDTEATFESLREKLRSSGFFNEFEEI
ncbi:hypothetical protein GF413_03195 [Candidatus Micrarchaeota archaeon]|nr:hypothetical protein [Candidatus Micrarchaeota archaeon]